MDIILQITGILILGLIMYQDLKYRAVSWILFVIGAVVLMAFSLLKTKMAHYLQYIAINWVFILVLISILSLYIMLRYKKLNVLFSSFIGAGDLLFLLMVSLAMPPGNYILFTIFSLFFALIGYIILRALVKSQHKIVPLAGLQALFLIMVLIVNLLGKFDISNDYLIYQILLKV